VYSNPNIRGLCIATLIYVSQELHRAIKGCPCLIFLAGVSAVVGRALASLLQTQGGGARYFPLTPWLTLEQLAHPRTWPELRRNIRGALLAVCLPARGLALPLQLERLPSALVDTLLRDYRHTVWARTAAMARAKRRHGKLLEAQEVIDSSQAI